MPFYRDEEIIRKVWELKRKHPRWGVRRIGGEIGESKDKVYRVLRRIKKGDIEVTEDKKVIDRTEPKEIVARQKAKLERALSQEETSKSKQPQVGGNPQKTSSDPLEEVLESDWEIECDKCKGLFKHTFTDEEIYNLIKNGFAYVSFPECKDYAPWDIAQLFPTDHRVFVRLSDVFRAYVQKSRTIIYTENQKRFLTYGWWYKLLKPKRYAEMLKQVGHSEDRFFNVFLLKSDLEMRGIKVEKVIYVFGVFSWIYDLGVLPLLINLGNKLIRKRIVEYSTLRTREVSRVSLINTLVKVYNVLATPLLIVLEMLDKPFEHFGISDGIILLAKKEKAS